jgi:hypothetical protein
MKMSLYRNLPHAAHDPIGIDLDHSLYALDSIFCACVD